MGMLVSLASLVSGWSGQDSGQESVPNEPQRHHSSLYPMKGTKFWQEDSTCPACMSCTQPFSFLVRRHHCRLCGFIFCGSCSARQVPGPENSYPDQPMVRACLTCFTYYRASRIPRSKLSAMASLPTLNEFQRSEAASAESNLNPAMKLLIDSMDTYDNRTLQHQTQRSMILSRTVSDSKLLLVDLYHGHLRHVVKQLLIRHGLVYQIWLETIVNFALHCAWQLQPMPSDGTISEMINIVGVASGSASDSIIINGVVLKGLNVVHRKMATSIADPYILIIDGVLALTLPSTLTSLRSIPSASHVQSFVEKILILCPDVIICKETVSLQTARIFQDHGISVICGVSNSDLALLRRALHVRVLNATTLMDSSVESEQIYGRCGSFSIERYDLPADDPLSFSETKPSTFMKLSGSDPSFYATLLLQGVSSSAQSRALESIAKTAVFLAWSLSLEISYVSDSSATVAPEQFDHVSSSIGILDTDEDAIVDVDSACWNPLASSPLVASHVLASDRDDTSSEVPPEPSLHCGLASGQASTAELIWSLTFGIYWMHKEVSTSQKHVVCFRPRVARTTFYGAIDSSLGEFLFETCFNPKRICSCGRGLADHRCCIVHGNGKLIIEVDNLPQSLLQDQSDGIVSWLWCSECRRRSSPVTVLSSRTLRLSLTKYFEICFYDYRTRSRLDTCGHRIHRDMIRCFAFNNMIATFQYTMEVPFELSLMQRVVIPHHFSARMARLELSRLIWLLDVTQELALRHINRNAPALVIDSACDILRNRIVKECGQIRKAALDLAFEDIGLIRARQLYLPLLKTASGWILQANLTDRNYELAAVPKILRTFLTGVAKPALISARWDVPSTFGGRIVPITRSQVSTLIAHALSSLQHAAFIMGKRSIADIPAELRLTPLEKVLQASLLPAISDSGQDSCESVLRSVKHGSIPAKFAVTVDCGDAGRVWVGFAQQFQALRHCLCDNNYAVIDSLAKSRDWAAKGGKSNASFIRTWDRRLILKRINATEAKTFTNLAPDYFEYIANHIFQEHASALTPILGIFEITFPSNLSKFYILMPNLLNDPLIDHVFDLKGKASGRLVRDQSSSDAKHACHKLQSNADWIDINAEDFVNPNETSSGQVLQDENFALFTQGNPLPLLTESSQLLHKALENDARFLANLDIMDYSVLIGVRKTPPQRLIVGIIDYIRFYSLDKKVETTVKSFIEKDAPTILPPILYMQRFLDSMHRNFVCAPNRELSTESMPISALDVDPEDSYRLSSKNLTRASLPPLNETFITRRHSSVINGLPFRSGSFYKEI